MRDRVILITGASRGIGAALARRLASEGAKLALVARDGAALEALRTSLPRGDDVLAIAADVSDAAAMARAFAAIDARFGRLDAVVANAAVLALGSFERQSLEHLERIVATNVNGALITVHGALPLLRRGPTAGKRIVLVGSFAGRRGFRDLAAYSATKGALVAFADALRQELAGDGISVSLASPTTSRTAIRSRALSGAIPDDRGRTVEESAALVHRALATGDPWVEATPFWRLKSWVNLLAPRWYDRWLARRSSVAAPSRR